MKTNLSQHNELFFRIFPVPTFLASSSVGIDISEKTIRFVELVRNKKGIEIKKWGAQDMAFGIVQSGDILQPEELKKVLSHIKEQQEFQYISATMPEEKAYLFKTSVAVSTSGNIRESIEFILEENVPITRAESVFDYAVIPNQIARDTHDVSVSVLPADIVHNFLSAFKSAGLEPHIFQTESRAIARAVVREGDLGTHMIINFGKSKTGVSVVSEGVVQFTSTINIGGEDLTALIQKYLHVDEVEAERIKLTEGLVRRTENEIVFTSIIAAVSALKDEISRLFFYWNTHKDSVTGASSHKIERIILCGRDSLMEGFDDYIASSLKTHTEIANVWINVFPGFETVPAIPHDESLDYAAAIGVALQQII
ncbi:MAG: pilus assembly protein PilM [Candidatus Paceibacterota bacterium]